MKVEEKIYKEKKKWEIPKLYSLDIKQTGGGAPPGTTEGTEYNPTPGS